MPHFEMLDDLTVPSCISVRLTLSLLAIVCSLDTHKFPNLMNASAYLRPSLSGSNLAWSWLLWRTTRRSRLSWCFFYTLAAIIAGNIIFLSSTTLYFSLNSPGTLVSEQGEPIDLESSLIKGVYRYLLMNRWGNDLLVTPLVWRTQIDDVTNELRLLRRIRVFQTDSKRPSPLPESHDPIFLKPYIRLTIAGTPWPI